MNDDLVTILMIQIVAKMTVISEQQARSYEGISVHGGEKPSGPAPLAEKPMVDYWRDRFNRAESPVSRRVIALEALEALRLARRMPVPRGQEPVFGSPQWKRFVAESGEESKELARRFNCTARYINLVRRAMREGGLMPLDEGQRRVA